MIVIKTGIKPPSAWPPSDDERARIALSILKKYGSLKDRGWKALVTPNAIYVGLDVDIDRLAKVSVKDSEVWDDPWRFVPFVLVPNVSVDILRYAKSTLDFYCSMDVAGACSATELLNKILGYYRQDVGAFSTELEQLWSGDTKRRLLDYIKFGAMEATYREVRNDMLRIHDKLKDLEFEKRVILRRDGQTLLLSPDEALRSFTVEEVGSEEYIDVNRLLTPDKYREFRATLEEMKEEGRAVQSQPITPTEKVEQQTEQKREQQEQKQEEERKQEEQRGEEKQREEERKEQQKQTRGGVKTEIEIRAVPAVITKTFELVISMRPLQPEVRKKHREEEKLRAKA